MVHVQQALELSKQHRYFAIHIALDRGSPQIRQAMSEHANAMSEATSMLLFGGFLGNATHLPKFWQVPNKLWRGITMYRHYANFHLALLHFGQNRERKGEGET